MLQNVIVFDMTKPICEYIFRPMPEIWTDASTGKVLADVLAEYGIIVDDRTQFARINDYEHNMCFWYRAYTGGKISLTLYRL